MIYKHIQYYFNIKNVSNPRCSSSYKNCKLLQLGRDTQLDCMPNRNISWGEKADTSSQFFFFSQHIINVITWIPDSVYNAQYVSCTSWHIHICSIPKYEIWCYEGDFPFFISCSNIYSNYPSIMTKKKTCAFHVLNFVRFAL